MIDSVFLEKAFKELKVPDGLRADVIGHLIEIGQDALSGLDVLPIKNPSKLKNELRAIDGDIGRFLKRFGFHDESQNLDAALTSSRGIALVITNYANTIRPDRHKHWPLEDLDCRQHIESLFTEIQILKDAVISSMGEISGRVKKGRGGDRHKANNIRRETAWHLLRLYYETRVIKPGVTKRPSTGKRTGPAVRFLEFSLRAYGFDLKPSTAANLVDELKVDPDLPWNQIPEG